MDIDAGRIAELVSEACGLVHEVERGRGVPNMEAELEHLRALLVALAVSTCEEEAADAACAVAGEISAALGRLTAEPESRAA